MSINGTTTLNHSRNFLKLIVLEFESASTQQEKKCTDRRLFQATLFLFEMPFAAIPIP